MGREIAALQFTNAGTQPCTLIGYPTAVLLAGGAQVGTPSRAAGSTGPQIRLAPGATAQSTLNDYTSCSAPLSDSVRVGVPGSTQSVTLPATLRACTLRVGPLGVPG